MLKWLRLVMIGCLILSIFSVASGCKKKAATETKPAVEEEEKTPVEEEEEW